MSQTDFLTVIIYILILVILGGAWFLLQNATKNLRRISSDFQNIINQLEDWKRKWIY